LKNKSVAKKKICKYNKDFLGSQNQKFIILAHSEVGKQKK